MQLNLFEWDLNEISKGYSCLARLNFDQARGHFTRVLDAQPDHAPARAGLKATSTWQELLRDIEQVPVSIGSYRLWQAIHHTPFARTANEQDFRKTLIRTLLLRMEEAGLSFIEPDLSTGYLSQQLGDYVNAETQLRQQIKAYPTQGILYCFLADTLWLQGRRELANALYVTALLIDPEGLCNHPLHNRELVDLIHRHGPGMAPAHGFLHGVVPLVQPEYSPDTPAARTYTLLHQAEQARHRQDHEKMIATQESLEQMAPDFYRDYLLWLAARPHRAQEDSINNDVRDRAQ